MASEAFYVGIMLKGLKEEQSNNNKYLGLNWASFYFKRQLQ